MGHMDRAMALHNTGAHSPDVEGSHVRGAKVVEADSLGAVPAGGGDGEALLEEVNMLADGVDPWSAERVFQPPWAAWCCPH